ncbi:MAG: hypothetical protein LIO40_04675, partial [Ruminococcus sp.]|nr:hypothetical protein [Ruminococcus sp.]
FPTIRYLKRHLIRDTDRLIFANLLIRQIISTAKYAGGIFLTLDFSFFDKLFLFLSFQAIRMQARHLDLEEPTYPAQPSAILNF